MTKGEASKLRQLSESGLETSLIFLTETGLRKSILDATAPLREFLKDNRIHDYAEQSQGQSCKVILPANFFHKGHPVEISVSLYRPVTKMGDPRFWPYKLSQFAEPDNVLAVFINDRKLNFLNLSDEESVSLDATTSPLEEMLTSMRLSYDQVANELLAKLQKISAAGPIPAVGFGDTSVGATIEAALGIKINSDKAPDYKGIEIKSKRQQVTTRNTLFAQVPNWKLSEFKNAREMVEELGYDVPEKKCRKLYCTVSTQRPNPQGLILDVDLDAKVLNELVQLHSDSRSVCLWQLPKLHVRLQRKHRETFWITAEDITTSDGHFFLLKHINHTRRPSSQQFDRLLEIGQITVDHLIKQTSKRVTEKGPLFKIRPNAIDELFLGLPKLYNLS
ncbi:MAG: MvaI/BcnI family restriction endonuclease [Puniceicoccaceae bacterium]